MIRPFTCVCLLLSAGSGLYLYQSKHQAQLLDRKIEHVLKQADAARERAGVLRAEYTLLNDPQRLKDLAGQHLTLATTAPTQFTTWAELERRLPAAGPPSAAEPEEPVPVLSLPQPPAGPTPIATRAEPPRPDAARLDALRAGAPAKPVAMAQAAATPAPQTPHAPPTVPRAQAAASTAAPATGTPLPRSALAAGRDAPPTPLFPAAGGRAPGATMVATIAAASGPRMPAYQTPPATAAEAIARIARGGPIDPSSPVVASALGMARSMMRAPAAVAPASAAQVYPLGSGG